jgi:hypothetical protein
LEATLLARKQHQQQAGAASGRFIDVAIAAALRPAVGVPAP